MRSSAGARRRLLAFASLVFVGNIDVQGNLPHEKYYHLFEPLPDYLQVIAFLDRIHGFLPGWEIPKLTPEQLLAGLRFHYRLLLRDPARTAAAGSSGGCATASSCGHGEDGPGRVWPGPTGRHENRLGPAQTAVSRWPAQRRGIGRDSDAGLRVSPAGAGPIASDLARRVREGRPGRGDRAFRKVISPELPDSQRVQR